MTASNKKTNLIFLIFWLLLAYMLIAICWWFSELYYQNINTSVDEIGELDKLSKTYLADYRSIIKERDNNTLQFIGEGLTFFLVILGGAIFLFKLILKEIKTNREQKNFLMAITHELKTPISVSKLNLETIQKRKINEEQKEKLISNTLSETNRLATLCNNLLLSYQIDGNAFNVSKAELNLSDLIWNIAERFKSNFPLRELNVEIEDDIIIEGDAFLLEIAISNLLENAAKYSPKDKVIYIELHKKNNVAIIKVIDNGIGIEDEEKKKVFNKFYRIGNEATKSAKGTGLGLYLTSRVSKIHDGNITIQDNIKEGSIFNFALKSKN